MKSMTILAAAMFLTVGISTSVAAQKGETFSGEIMDSACAKAGTHAGMMKSHPGLTAKDCTAGCVKNGAKYVLYDEANKKVYQLDDQKKPAEYAGDKVKVSGTLDKTSDTIHVSSIEGTT